MPLSNADTRKQAIFYTHVSNGIDFFLFFSSCSTKNNQATDGFLWDKELLYVLGGKDWKRAKLKEMQKYGSQLIFYQKKSWIYEEVW